MNWLLNNSYYLELEPLESAGAQPYSSLGILYIASFLREKGEYDVEVFDSTFADGLPAYEATVQRVY